MLLSDWSRPVGVRRSKHALPIKTVPWTSPRDLPTENVRICKIKKKSFQILIRRTTKRDALVYIAFFFVVVVFFYGTSDGKICCFYAYYHPQLNIVLTE